MCSPNNLFSQMTFRLTVTAFEYKTHTRQFRNNLEYIPARCAFESDYVRRVRNTSRCVLPYSGMRWRERTNRSVTLLCQREFAPDIAKLPSRGRYQAISLSTMLDFSSKIRTRRTTSFVFPFGIALKFETLR